MSDRQAIQVDPQTGLKTFDTRAAEGVGPDPRIRVRDHARRVAEGAASAAAGRDGSTPRSRRGTAPRRRRVAAPPTTCRWRASSRKYLEDVYSAAPVEREALTDECDVARGRGRLRRSAALVQAQPGRLRRRALLREGRRRRRHVVLEPLPRRRVRRRVVQLPAAARGDGLRPVDEVRVGLRDPRVLPEHGRAVPASTTTACSTPPSSATEWDEATARWTVHTDRGDSMRARIVILANGILTSPKLARIDGHGDLPGRVVPHVALALRHRSHRQGDRHHRHGRDRRAGDPRAGEGGQGAVRLPAHAVDDRRARPARDHAARSARRGRTSRAGRGPAVPGSPGSPPGGRRSRPTTTTSPARSPTSRSARSTSRELTPEELIQKQLDSNFRIMEQIRARVDAIVEDPATAEALKPWYPYGCKRPTFHDEYLPTFNRPQRPPRRHGAARGDADRRARRRPRRPLSTRSTC